MLWGWAVILFVAWLVRARMKRLGAADARVWLWPLAVLAFGPVAAVVSRLIETPRRWRRLG
ncbi:MAG: hypothetical protein R3F17_02120 [Planctomycetota bacterium]